MKKKILALLIVFGVMISFNGNAQQNVKKAFDELLNNSNKEYSETHELGRDPETGVKISQADVYKFTLPASKFKLVENVLNAFKADQNSAYSMSQGRSDKYSRQIRLDDGYNREGILINPSGYEYEYACYLAPKSEDKTGNYRYAYGINWKKNKDNIEGTLVVTYSTTLKYRQNQSVPKVYYNSGKNADKWLTTLVTYIQTLTNEDEDDNVNTRQIIAAKLFKHAQLSQTDKGITVEDKTTARELLKTLMGEKNKFDKVTNQLLDSSLTAIKY